MCNEGIKIMKTNTEVADMAKIAKKTGLIEVVLNVGVMVAMVFAFIVP